MVVELEIACHVVVGSVLCGNPPTMTRKRGQVAVTNSISPASGAVPLRRWALGLMLIFFNVADVLLTRFILVRGGSEANPIMQPVMGNAASALALKTFVALTVGALLLLSPKSTKAPDIAVGAVVVLYVFVMGWNIGVLLQSGAAL